MAKLMQKISSMVVKTGKIFTHGRLSMNEKAARKIQKMAFDRRTQTKKTVCTPTYKKIAEQLDTKYGQIFEGAVFYLAKIAMLRKRNCSDILRILQEHAASSTLSSERREYLEKKIEEIRNNL